MGISFAASAEAYAVGEDEDVVEIPIEGIVYKARRPTTAQAALMVGGGDMQIAFNLIEGLMGPQARAHIERLVWARKIDLADLLDPEGTEQNPDGGLIPQIIQEFSAARPTQPSSGSASSQTTGGRRSTGRSPGKVSSRSTSRSTDSSTS